MWASDVRRSHAVNGVHDVQPPSKSHIRHCHNSMQMACGSAEREREGEEREEGQLTHSLHRTSSWHTPPFISSPFLFPPHFSLPHPPPILTPSPSLIWLTTTTHHGCSHSTCLSSHTHVPSLTQCMCQYTEETQQQQQPHYSCSSPPPAAHVLLHLHATHAHTRSKWYMCE